MKLSMHLAAVVALAIAGNAFSQSPPSELAPEDFAIMPWGTTPADPAILKEIKACGFNLAGFVAPSGVANVREAGLKCFVYDGRVTGCVADAPKPDDEVRQRIGQVAAEVKDDPAVYGYYVKDEPGSAYFPSLAQCAKAVVDAHPGAVPYINLFPNYANAQQLGADSYDAYLDLFVETVSPSYISYDHYALMEDGSVRGGYFQNLESMRAAALRHGIPFWNIVLSNAHFTYAEPSEAGFRFQAYTTLAYGARGISYFTYFAPQIGNYRLAPIDQFGHKTPTWDMLRNVNLQIHNLAPTYIKLKSVNVFHYPEAPEGCQGIDSSVHLSSLDIEQGLVGEFEGPDGVPFVMVVNTSLHNSVHFELTFKKSGPIMMTSPYSGVDRPWQGERKWLAPGQGMLLSLGK